MNDSIKNQTHKSSAVSRQFLISQTLRLFAMVVLIIFNQWPSNASADHTNAKQLSQLPVASAIFDEQGRLWRILVDQDQLYLDYSDDYGLHYSPPMAVNNHRQKIIVSAEDRPTLAIDRHKRLIVLYASDQPVRYSRYITFSEDDGKTFSMPQLISQPDINTMQSQATIVVSKQNNASVFWLEEKIDSADTGAKLNYRILNDQAKFITPVTTITGNLCNCCRLAAGTDHDGQAVIFARFIYDNDIRDHGLIRMEAPHSQPGIQRVTYDNWEIRACPHHGPALAIGETERYHITWFSQGSRNKGLFYAYSDDHGKQFTPPHPIGNSEKMAGHASIVTQGRRVVIAWQEFDGKTFSIHSVASSDNGMTWQPERILASTKNDADYPFLLSDQHSIYLSWSSSDKGYQLIPITNASITQKSR